MDRSATEFKELSDLPYVEISQVDDDAGGQDAKPSPRSEVNPNEKPQNARLPEGKPVILRTRARLWTSLVHVLPLAISALLITINLQRWYWIDEDSDWVGLSTNTVRNLLQLAAKVYELLVIASLGALTLKVFKRHLVESHLPLGLLTGAYRVGDIPYVFSSFFWRAVRKTSWPLALLVLGNTILSTLVGPSSAILLVPELDWYPLPGAFSYVQLPAVFYNSPTNLTWPRVVSASSTRDPEDWTRTYHACDSFFGWWSASCPAGGFADLTRWFAEWESSDLGNDMLSQDPTGIVRRRLSAAEHWRNGTMAMTTISMAPLISTGRLLNFNNLRRDNMGAIRDTPKFRLTTSSKSTVFQPLVQSQCTVYDHANLSPDALPAFRVKGLNCLGDPACESMLESRSYVHPLVWNVSDLPESGMRWQISAPTASGNQPLLASVTLPYRNGSTAGALVFACSIIAHWMPATLSVSPKDSDLVTSNVTDHISGLKYDKFDLLTARAGPAIKIEADWVDFMLPSLNITSRNNDTRIKYRPVDAFLSAFLTTNDKVSLGDGKFTRFLAAVPDPEPGATYLGVGRAESQIQMAFTGMVTEALARVAANARSYMVRSYNDTTVVMTNIGTIKLETLNEALNETVTWSNGTIVDINGKDPRDRDLDKPISSPFEYLVLNLSVDGASGLARSPQEFVERLDAAATRIEFEVERYGYGSGKAGPTLKFALAVVYIYLIVVGSYFFYVTVVSTFWWKSDIPTINAWGDVAELLLLAWNSRPSRALGRTSVAVPGSKWRAEVGIRAEATGRAQLVTGHENVELLRRNQLYH